MAGSDSTLYLYTSLTAGSSHIITATSRLETILKANKIPFQAIDIATDDAARRLWGRYSKGRKLPGLVKYRTIIGDLEQIEEWNEYGELKGEIGAITDPDDFSPAALKTSSAPKESVEPLKPAETAGAITSKPTNPVASTGTSKPNSGISTPHVQIQNPPVTESKEDQRPLALRLAGEEAAAKAKENALSKLGTKPSATEADGKVLPSPAPNARATEAAATQSENTAIASTPAAVDNVKEKEEENVAAHSKKEPSVSPAVHHSSVAPEIVPPATRPSLADETAVISSANFHSDNVETLGLIGHHRGSQVSATTPGEQGKALNDIQTSIPEASADGDNEDTKLQDDREGKEKDDSAVVEEDEQKDKPERKSTTNPSADNTQTQDPKDESKAGVSVDD